MASTVSMWRKKVKKNLKEKQRLEVFVLSEASRSGHRQSKHWATKDCDGAAMSRAKNVETDVMNSVELVKVFVTGSRSATGKQINSMGPVKFVQIKTMGSINLAQINAMRSIKFVQIFEKILSKSHGDQRDGFSEIREDRRDGFLQKKTRGNLRDGLRKKKQKINVTGSANNRGTCATGLAQFLGIEETGSLKFGEIEMTNCVRIPGEGRANVRRRYTKQRAQANATSLTF